MEIQRKLASIKIVKDISPILDADAIELITIDGWKVVAQKNLYKIGDKVVYFEIDSFLPMLDCFEFLKKTSLRTHPITGNPGYRIKTIKLRGQISQGLIAPWNQFFKYVLIPENYSTENTDVTEFIGVIKWDKPISAEMQGKVKGNFPSFIPKTDQERIQNVYNKYKKLYEGIKYEVTLKLDGTSMTVYKKDGVIGVCSRNLDLVEDYTNTYWKTAKESGAIDLVENYFGNIALQGELMGPGIQDNRENLTEHKFYVFDIYDIDLQIYRDPLSRSHLVPISMQIPILDNDFYAFDKSLFALLELAKGKSINHAVREGVVLKPMTAGLPSFKIINNDFLIKEKD